MQAATRSVADGDMAKALKAAYEKEMQKAVENKVLEVGQLPQPLGFGARLRSLRCKGW
jgi:hypothetical protein